MYWHYINNQYFPISLLTPENTHSFIELHEIGSSLLSRDLTDDWMKDILERESKNLTVDKMIDLSESELLSNNLKVKNIQSIIEQRIHTATNPSGENVSKSDFSENPQVNYTVENLRDIQKYVKSLNTEEEILRDSIYQNNTDRLYLELKEKSLKKQNNFSLRKKYSSFDNLITTRYHGSIILNPPKNTIKPSILRTSDNCQVCSEGHDNVGDRLLNCSVNVDCIL